jgi:hypothetical protein
MAEYNGDIGTYSHPYFTEMKEMWLNKVQGPASVTDFAHFCSRNKVLVRAVHLWLRSDASGTAGSLHVCRSGVTIASKALAGYEVSAEYYACMTLTTLNTLHTITEIVSLQVSGTADRGKVDVLYEYQILYPATLIGS